MKLIDLLKVAKCPLILLVDSSHSIIIDYNKKEKLLLYNTSILEWYYKYEVVSFEICEKIISNNRTNYLKVKLEQQSVK